MFMPVNVHGEETGTVEVVVRQGDTLSSFSNKYLEKPEMWPEIARLNQIKNPNLIFPGQKLLIPDRLFRGEEIAGKISFSKGLVQYRKTPDGQWMPIPPEYQISEGDTLRTGPDGHMEIMYEDGVVIMMRPEATLEVRAAHAKGGPKRLYQLFLSIGRLISKIRKGTGVESRYEILTPSAIAAARGTDFRISVSQDTVTRCEVILGQVGVASGGQEVVVPAGQGTLARKGHPPLPPRKLIPPPVPYDLEDPYTMLPAAVSFAQLEEAVTLRVTLSTDEAGKDILAEQLLNPGEPFLIREIKDGTYYLLGSSIDADGLEGPLGDAEKIRVRVNPVAPIIKTPRTDSELLEQLVEVRWLAVAGAENYHLQIARDSIFEQIVMEEKALSASGHSVFLPDSGSYYARVSAIAVDGHQGPWSGVIKTTLIAPPVTPQFAEPVLTDESLTLGWEKQETETLTEVQMASDPDFKKLIFEKRLNSSELSVPAPEAAGNYYLRIRSIDERGLESEFSPTREFTVKKENKLAVIISYGTFLIAVLLMIAL